jgi:uncharacterized DUF497 family protein
MGYRFEWDAEKAAENLRKHGVAFDEAITTFGDPLNVLLPDPTTAEAKSGIFCSVRPIGIGCLSWLLPSDHLGPA